MSDSGRIDWETMSDERAQCEKCRSRRGHPYSFLVGTRRNATTRDDYAVAQKRIQLTVQGEITVLICDDCLAAQRRRWRSWGVYAAAAATGLAILAFGLIMALAREYAVGGLLLLGGALAAWGFVGWQLLLAPIERAEHMAISIRAAGLRARGLDQFWTHKEWADLGGG